MITHKDLAYKIEYLERKYTEHDKRFIAVFNAIKQLLTEKEESSKNKGPMGFVVYKKEESVQKAKRKN